MGYSGGYEFVDIFSDDSDQEMMNVSDAFYMSPKKGKKKIIEDDELCGNDDEAYRPDDENDTEIEDVKTTNDEWELARVKVE